MQSVLIKIAQEKTGKTLSAEEKEMLGNLVEQITESLADDDCEDSEEIKAILREESIEQLAKDIRGVVGGYTISSITHSRM